jgi:hypothetical protein
MFPNLYTELNIAPNIFLPIIPLNKHIMTRLLLEGPVSNPALVSNVVEKVKQSRYRPGGAQRVPRSKGPQFS